MRQVMDTGYRAVIRYIKHRQRSVSCHMYPARTCKAYLYLSGNSSLTKLDTGCHDFGILLLNPVTCIHRIELGTGIYSGIQNSQRTAFLISSIMFSIRASVLAWAELTLQPCRLGSCMSDISVTITGYCRYVGIRHRHPDWHNSCSQVCMCISCTFHCHTWLVTVRSAACTTLVWHSRVLSSRFYIAATWSISFGTSSEQLELTIELLLVVMQQHRFNLTWYSSSFGQTCEACYFISM